MSEVQQTILDSPEFQKFAVEARALIDDWYAAHRTSLQAIDPDTRPNDLIATISDDLLARFGPVPLLDEYDVYEQLMTYWHTVMHDDVFLVMHEGWVNASRPRLAIDDKDRKLTETPDLEIGSGRHKTKYKMDLVPPALIVARYLAEEQARVDELNVEVEAATQAVDEYVEEHGGDEGLLVDAVNDKGKLTQAAVRDALKEAKAADDQETIECAQVALEHLQADAAARKAANEALAELDTATLKKYADLNEADVQSLVLDDKWAATIRNRVSGEVNALTLALVARIQQLGERYAETVGDLDAELDSLGAKSASHLDKMGVE